MVVVVTIMVGSWLAVEWLWCKEGRGERGEKGRRKSRKEA